MKILLSFLLVLASPLFGQAPRAEVVEQVLEANPAEVRYLRGKNIYDEAQAAKEMAQRKQFYERAAQIFTDYLADFPEHENSEMAWWYLGNSQYHSGNVDDAKRCFNTLLNRYGNGKWAAAAAYMLARDHYNKGDYAFAAPLFERFAAQASKKEERPRGNYLAGNCYRMLGREREAIGAFKKVIEDPDGGSYVGQSKNALGNLALKAGKLQDALTFFEQVIEGEYSDKLRGEAALQASLIAGKLGQKDLAAKYLNLIISTAGMIDVQTDAQTALMINHYEKKNYQEVVDLFNRNANAAVGDKEADRLMIAGKAYMKLKEPSQALKIFREVEKLVKPETDTAIDASYNRLLCFFQVEGRHVPDQVDAFLQLYRKSRPDDMRIHTALMIKAETLFADKRAEAAAKVYSEINANLISETNRPGLLYQRGWCFSETGDAQGAIRSLGEFINKYPDDSRVPSALAKRAKALADSSESAKAIADFDRLTKLEKPQDLVAFAWLESARLRRAENNIPDMIVRYQGLMKNAGDLSDKVIAEANYWIGWGMVKTNAAKDAVEYLEKARELRSKDYGKHAGLLLALGYFAAQNPDKLSAEIALAIEGNYDADIPDQAIQWSGMQSYNARDFTAAAKSLELVSNPEEPRETAKEVWRYLAKSRIESNDHQGALTAVDNVLAVEDNPGWKADGLLDRGRALLGLQRPDDARKAADEALELRPQGHTSAGLNILVGDLELLAGDVKQAAAKYLIVVEFHEDKELKPLALWKLIKVLEAQTNRAEAEKYSSLLQTEFPDWKAPTL